MSTSTSRILLNSLTNSLYSSVNSGFSESFVSSVISFTLALPFASSVPYFLTSSTLDFSNVSRNGVIALTRLLIWYLGKNAVCSDNSFVSDWISAFNSFSWWFKKKS